MVIWYGKHKCSAQTRLWPEKDKLCPYINGNGLELREWVFWSNRTWIHLQEIRGWCHQESEVIRNDLNWWDLARTKLRCADTQLNSFWVEDFSKAVFVCLFVCCECEEFLTEDNKANMTPTLLGISWCYLMKEPPNKYIPLTGCPKPSPFHPRVLPCLYRFSGE